MSAEICARFFVVIFAFTAESEREQQFASYEQPVNVARRYRFENIVQVDVDAQFICQLCGIKTRVANHRAEVCFRQERLYDFGKVDCRLGFRIGAVGGVFRIEVEFAVQRNDYVLIRHLVGIEPVIVLVVEQSALQRAVFVNGTGIVRIVGGYRNVDTAYFELNGKEFGKTHIDEEECRTSTAVRIGNRRRADFKE